jgi:hypothetical protein
MVRLHSRGVQGRAAILGFESGGPAAEEDDMTLPSGLRDNPDAFSPDGDLLVFAPPLVTGFLGAPLALAALIAKRRAKGPAGRNLARRRAYVG